MQRHNPLPVPLFGTLVKKKKEGCLELTPQGPVRKSLMTLLCLCFFLP